MINKLLNKNSYKDLTSMQVKQLIEYLKQNEIEFNLTAKLKTVKFNPKLPDVIYNNMQQYTLFALANYTYSSLVIKQNHIEFETGFGAENFGSVCSIKYTSIFQIGVDESILFINPIATVDKYNDNFDEENQKQRSMNAFKLHK